MNISRKWSVAAAAALSLALVGGGAVSANAAEGDILNPQSNGSPGSFYLWDGNTGEFADSTTRVYTPSEAMIAVASATDFNAEINPAATRPVTGANEFTGVYRFVAERNAADVAGGLNTWNAYAVDSAAGPNGGTWLPSMALNDITNGITTVIAQGGEYWYGVAYTTNAGVTTVGAVYREITIEAGTGNYTVGPVEVEGPAAADLITEADLVTADSALVTETVDSTQLSINAGTANANKTLNVGVFSGGARSELGTVVLDADGAGTVDASAVAVGAASKLFLYEFDGADEVLTAWDTFTLTTTFSTSAQTDLTVDVTNSGRFELVAPAATLIDLGDVRRNQTTVPVALGQFTVYDDRDVLSGWNLNVTAADFAGAGNTTVAKTALGYAPRAVALTEGVTVGAAKPAGEGSFGVLAEGAVGSSTAEVGAVLDTDLTFKAPINAAKGTHTSTLTLDLVSK